MGALVERLRRGSCLIAEHKPTVARAEPVAIARWFVEEHGAGAISVHVTSDHGGSVGDLEAIREVVDVPLLAKGVYGPDVVSSLALAGADAILLVVGRSPRPGELAVLTRRAGLDVVAEGHSNEDLRVAGRIGDIVAVNARDLDTGELDPFRHAAALAALPDGRPRIAASGLASWETPAGYDARLIGTSLTERYASATSAA